MLPINILLVKLRLAVHPLFTRIQIVLRAYLLMASARFLTLTLDPLPRRHIWRLYILLTAGYRAATDGESILNLAALCSRNSSVPSALSAYHLTLRIDHLMTGEHADLIHGLVGITSLRLASSCAAVGPIRAFRHVSTNTLVIGHNLPVFEVLRAIRYGYLTIILDTEAILIGAVTAATHLLTSNVETLRVEMVRGSLLLLLLFALHSAHGLHLGLTAEDVTIRLQLLTYWRRQVLSDIIRAE